MIIGTWNLEVYLSRQSSRGIAMADEIHRYPVDLWFLTELHSDWEVDHHAICFAPPRDGAPETRRLAGIATSWAMEPIPARKNPPDGWMCLARITNPFTNETFVAASAVLPWRGITPYWRTVLDRELTFSEAFRYVLDYVVQRIEEVRRPGEDVLWGGDFNQALAGRDYVGTLQGRTELQQSLDRLGLHAATSHLPASIHTHPAIDHIAVPSDWTLRADPIVARPAWKGKPLSDHALYVIECNPVPHSH